jgi:hypothetical protein
MKSGGKCAFNSFSTGGLSTCYGPHEPREDVQIELAGHVDAHGFGHYEAFVCKHCGCIYWPQDEPEHP